MVSTQRTLCNLRTITIINLIKKRYVRKAKKGIVHQEYERANFGNRALVDLRAQLIIQLGAGGWNDFCYASREAEQEAIADSHSGNFNQSEDKLRWYRQAGRKYNY
jgi:hypothetical protein